MAGDEMQILPNVKANQTLRLNISDAKKTYSYSDNHLQPTLFHAEKDVLNYKHNENVVDDLTDGTAAQVLFSQRTLFGEGRCKW